jgi:hypothetical protein
MNRKKNFVSTIPKRSVLCIVYVRRKDTLHIIYNFHWLAFDFLTVCLLKQSDYYTIYEREIYAGNILLRKAYNCPHQTQSFHQFCLNKTCLLSKYCINHWLMASFVLHVGGFTKWFLQEFKINVLYDSNHFVCHLTNWNIHALIGIHSGINNC